MLRDDIKDCRNREFEGERRTRFSIGLIPVEVLELSFRGKTCKFMIKTMVLELNLRIDFLGLTQFVKQILYVCFLIKNFCRVVNNKSGMEDIYDHNNILVSVY